MKNTGIIMLSFLSLLLILGYANIGHANEAAPWEIYDFGGETLRWWATPDITPLGMRGDYDWRDPDTRLQGHIEEVEKMFNVNIEFVDLPRSYYTDPAELATDVMAGEVTVDFFNNTRSWGFHNFAVEGLITPLDDYLQDPYDWYANSPEAYRTPRMVAGTTYGIPFGYFAKAPAVVIWNIPRFEEDGLPNLYELYKEGEWTWDAMKEIAIQGMRDTTGDGLMDQAGFSHDKRRASHLFASNNARYARVVDGRVVFALDEPQAIETLEFFQALGEEVFVDSEVVEAAPASYMMSLDFAHQLRREDRYPGWGLVPVPMGPEANEYVSAQYNQHIGVIPINTQHDPRAILEVIAALNQLTAPYIEGDVESRMDLFWKSRELWVPDRDSLEIWKWLVQNVTHDEFTHPIWRSAGLVVAAEPATGLESVFVEEIMEKGRNPSTVISEQAPYIQSFLDDIYN